MKTQGRQRLGDVQYTLTSYEMHNGNENLQNVIDFYIVSDDTRRVLKTLGVDWYLSNPTSKKPETILPTYGRSDIVIEYFTENHEEPTYAEIVTASARNGREALDFIGKFVRNRGRFESELKRLEALGDLVTKLYEVDTGRRTLSLAIRIEEPPKWAEDYFIVVAERPKSVFDKFFLHLTGITPHAEERER